jgi:hypothetical protein
MRKMKVFYSKDHDGHYPVGVCSIVIAENELKAKNKLKKKLQEYGLDSNEPFTLHEIDLTKDEAYIVLDGNY